MRGRADLIALVEAAYRVDGDLSAWAGGVLDAARPLLDGGMGVALVTYEVTPQRELRIGERAELGTWPGFADAFASMSKSAPPEAVDRAYLGAPGCETYRGVLGDVPGAVATFEEQIAPFLRLEEFVAVNCFDATHRGVALVSPRAEVERPADCGHERWLMLGAHLCAGLRLRRALAASGEAEPDLPLDGEAVLEPGGEVVDARGVARDEDRRATLRDAARRADRARGRLRRADADEALTIWEGLVEGRWSLVDWHDSDGRRYLVARKNDSAARDPRALSEREWQVARSAALGHPSKVIAYELGLSESTIATHLARAQRKLNVESRAHLVSVMRQLSPSA